MLKEIKKLHAMGFSIIWLYPKSKAPIGMRWTSKKRKTWTQLVDEYEPGMNVGVRLGRHSRLKDGTYLSVIDCDVKSSKIKHREEMNALANKVVSTESWVVLSGRMNGSRHIYIRTKKPLSPKRLDRSNDLVKTYMPSIKTFSQREEEKLSKTERAKGIHIRPAWEVSVMGEGQQVVLPPSIHPDTKRSYKWGIDRSEIKLALVDLPNVHTPPEREAVKTIDFVDVDLSRLDSETRKAIVTGKDVTDRSTSMFHVSRAMAKAGYSETEVISALTNTDWYLGQTGYDHTQSRSRTRAAAWVRRYTTQEAHQEVAPSEVFKDKVKPDKKLSPEDAEKQLHAVVGKSDWRQKLERIKGDETRPKASVTNIKIILTNACDPTMFKHNLFSGTNLYGDTPPWNRSKKGSDVRDIDLTDIMFWLAQRYRLETTEKKLFSAMSHIASKNSFHPVRDYIESLEWDGEERLDMWLKTYMGAHAPERYLAAVSRKSIVSMIARVYEPGIKSDHMIIMEGEQGCGKSTAVSILSSPWYSDTKINVGEKDAIVSLQGVWVLEMGELSSLRHTDIEEMKAFISRRTDRVRMPYGHIAENFPRQCTFIGTVNPGDYLRDPTGNRRFWPVKVEQCRFDDLIQDRDQLIAEAKFVYDLGEELYLKDAKELAGAREEQERAAFTDTMLGKIQDFINSKPEEIDTGKFQMADLFSPFGPLADVKETRVEQLRTAEMLRKMGYQKHRFHTDMGTKKWFWIPGEKGVAKKRFLITKRRGAKQGDGYLKVSEVSNDFNE